MIFHGEQAKKYKYVHLSTVEFNAPIITIYVLPMNETDYSQTFVRFI